MKYLQQHVAEFVACNCMDANVAHRLLDFVSEAGELSEEALKGSDYGAKEFTASPAWRDEMGDVLFSLICLANMTDVNMEDALESALRKYERRIAKGGSAGSKDMHDD